MPLLTRTTFVLLAVAVAVLAVAPAPPLVALAAAFSGALAAGAALVGERAIRQRAPRRLAGAMLGLLAGLLGALLVSLALAPTLAVVEPVVARLAPALLVLGGAWLGWSVGEHSSELLAVRRAWDADTSALASAPEEIAVGTHKVLDTSVVIDGRIADIIEAGFVEGTLIVPQFVLRELQQVADSSDGLKRNRGRKGLDVLKAVQDSSRVMVELTDRDFPEIADVDAKLLALAEERHARILTNDYNLNKVAQLHGVVVLNVNDLANAMKPVVLPGEQLVVQVLKEGKERNQGVGYLDDGTMVVVENGRDLIGETVPVLVSSVIQTNAGKMIFGSPEDTPVVAPRIARRDSDAAARNGRGASQRVAGTS